MDNRVVIRYVKDSAAGPSQAAHIAGEQFTVTDAATAKAKHPHADILKYADGRKYVAAQDESVQEVKAAQATDTNKPKADSKSKAKDS